MLVVGIPAALAALMGGLAGAPALLLIAVLAGVLVFAAGNTLQVAAEGGTDYHTLSAGRQAMVAGTILIGTAIIAVVKFYMWCLMFMLRIIKAFVPGG